MAAGGLLIARRLDEAEDAIGMQLASLARIEQGRPAEVEALLRLAMEQFPGFAAWRGALAYCLRD